MKRVAVLVSGGGTNLQALIDAQKSGRLGEAEICCVISSNANAFALKRAEDNGIESCVLKKSDYKSAEQYDDALVSLLESKNVDLVVLAGFMTIFGNAVISAFENKIINIHPSLIPSFSGKGFYGLKVHEEALRRGVKLTGATVHFVNEVCDGGAIILQKAVEVLSTDTPQSLQKRVMEQAEWVILPEAVRLFCEGRIKMSGSTAAVM